MKNNYGIMFIIMAFASLCSAQQLHFGPKKESQGKLLDRVVAFVGNDNITQSELNALKHSSNASESNLLEELITQKLLVQAAEKRNISISDSTVDDAINHQAKAKGLTRNALVDQLQSKGVNFSEYRNQIRNQIMINVLQQAVGRNLVDISEREVDDLIAQQTRNGDDVTLVDIFIALPHNAPKTQVEKAIAKGQRLYKLIKDSPNKITGIASQDVAVNRLGTVSISRIPSTFQQALKNIKIGEVTPPLRDRDGIHILKVEGKGQAEEKELSYKETQVKHILIRTDDPNSQEIALTKKRIDEVKRLLNDGESFEAIASQFSEDAESSGSGGQLGWVKPGQMVPEFERVMNATDIKQTSQPFQTQFGWHIVKVEARRQAETNPNERKRMAARARIFDQRIEEAWAMWVQRLRDEAYVKIVK